MVYIYIFIHLCTNSLGVVICAAWQLKVVPLLMGTECLIITKDGDAQKGTRFKPELLNNRRMKFLQLF